MNTGFVDVGDAYQAIKMDVLAFPNGRTWETVVGHYQVLSKMVSCRWWLTNGDQIDRKWNNGQEIFNGAACDAAIYLRNDHLRATGKRIWGLTFTLFPDGKFDIEYDYNKPDEYDESDDLEPSIPLSEALHGLVATDVHLAAGGHADATPEQQFLSQALSQLQIQTAKNTKDWGLGSEAQWNLDMNASTLRFSFVDGRVLDAQVQVVGTYNTNNGTFLWGWDHPSVPLALRRAAQRVHDYGVEHGIERFTTRSIECTQDQAWELSAVAAKLNCASGAYRGYANGTWVYMTFDDPVVVNQS